MVLPSFCFLDTVGVSRCLSFFYPLPSFFSLSHNISTSFIFHLLITCFNEFPMGLSHANITIKVSKSGMAFVFPQVISGKQLTLHFVF